jgi:hypothetical protein
VTRRLALLLVVATAAAASVGVLLAGRVADPSTAREPASGISALSLLVVQTDAGPLGALVGSTGFGRAGALVVVGSPDDVGLGQRVRDLLGVGTVSVPSDRGSLP